jgi:hypothetical protein
VRQGTAVPNFFLVHDDLRHVKGSLRGQKVSEGRVEGQMGRIRQYSWKEVGWGQ